MALESLSYQLEMAAVLPKNHRGEHRVGYGLWTCAGTCTTGDWGVGSVGRLWRVVGRAWGCHGLEDLSKMHVSTWVAARGF